MSARCLTERGAPANWLRVMEEAQSLGLTTSATNVIGFGETSAERVEHMRRIRELQDRSLVKIIGIHFLHRMASSIGVNSFGRRNRGQNKHELGAGSIRALPS